ncbi:hypothetical protein CPB86DRAFT_860234 [Serendipita vermifera]|nr:hypothetical protein CPB86DRAFT_860234 [Serendipita vermifera]
MLEMKFTGQFEWRGGRVDVVQAQARREAVSAPPKSTHILEHHGIFDMRANEAEGAYAGWMEERWRARRHAETSVQNELERRVGGIEVGIATKDRRMGRGTLHSIAYAIYAISTSIWWCRAATVMASWEGVHSYKCGQDQRTAGICVAWRRVVLRVAGKVGSKRRGKPTGEQPLCARAGCKGTRVVGLALFWYPEITKNEKKKYLIFLNTIFMLILLPAALGSGRVEPPWANSVAHYMAHALGLVDARHTQGTRQRRTQTKEMNIKAWLIYVRVRWPQAALRPTRAHNSPAGQLRLDKIRLEMGVGQLPVYADAHFDQVLALDLAAPAACKHDTTTRRTERNMKFKRPMPSRLPITNRQRLATR